MTTLALYSNKGGVGKTAAAVNLAYLAAQSGLMTLICDLDPQASTTFYFRVKPKLKPKAQGLVRGRKQVDRSIKGTDYENLDLLPADFSHRNLDLSFNSHRRRKQRLRTILKPLRKEYDLIILDCPPSINIVAENIFNAADHLLVPLIPTTLSLRSHAQLHAFLDEHRYRSTSLYTFFSFVDGRKRMHRELAAWARGNFDGVLQSAIPYLSHVEQMGIYRQPVPEFAPASPASAAYQELWKEIYGVLLDEPK
jgi:cellulose biosynthesis protein BcsQ